MCRSFQEPQMCLYTTREMKDPRSAITDSLIPLTTTLYWLAAVQCHFLIPLQGS